MRRLLRLAAVNLAVLCTLLVLLAVGLPLARDFFDLFGSDRADRDSALPNYVASPWAETHFREIAELRTEYFSYVAWRRGLFAGETVTIEGPFHERRTPQPPGAAAPSVFFFGGSTMWGTGSRDQETIPALYAAATGRMARNFGESGYVAHQNLEMLLWLLQVGERPDIVVFYDGVNDVVQKCRAGAPLFADGQRDRIRARLRFEQGSPGYYFAPLLAWLAETAGEEPAGGSDCAGDPARARAVAEALLRDWETARLVAEGNGIRFHAVLQPVLYFSETRSDHLRAEDEERRRQYEAVYPLLRTLAAERGFTDFTAVLDLDEYLYIDFCHLSPNGNALVAAALVPLLQ